MESKNRFLWFAIEIVGNVILGNYQADCIYLYFKLSRTISVKS